MSLGHIVTSIDHIVTQHFWLWCHYTKQHWTWKYVISLAKNTTSDFIATCVNNLENPTKLANSWRRGGALPYLKVVRNICASNPHLDSLVPILDLGSNMIFDLVDLFFLDILTPHFHKTLNLIRTCPFSIICWTTPTSFHRTFAEVPSTGKRSMIIQMSCLSKLDTLLEYLAWLKQEHLA